MLPKWVTFFGPLFAELVIKNVVLWIFLAALADDFAINKKKVTVSQCYKNEVLLGCVI